MHDRHPSATVSPMASVATARTEKGAQSFSEVVQKYPDVPKLVALKIDVQRRGVHYTEEALRHVDESKHQLRGTYIFGSRDAALTPVPESLVLRDGTTILTDPTPVEQHPYGVDWSDGVFVLRDGEEIVDEVELWPQPAYYDKTTSRGTPMKYVITARPATPQYLHLELLPLLGQRQGVPVLRHRHAPQAAEEGMGNSHPARSRRRRGNPARGPA